MKGVIKSVFCLLLIVQQVAAQYSRAPDFTLKNTKGENIRLSEYRGEVIVLHFWATWCGACRDEMKKLQSLQDKFELVGLKVIGLNLSQKREKVSRYISNAGIKYEVLLDSKNLTAEKYKVEDVPTTVLLDRDGNFRYRYENIASVDLIKIEAHLRELLK